MRSALPKMLHPLCGRPVIAWPVAAARAAGAERVVVVRAITQASDPQAAAAAFARRLRGQPPVTSCTL